MNVQLVEHTFLIYTSITEDDFDSLNEDKIYNEQQAKDDVKDLNKAIALDSEKIMLYEMRVKRFIHLKEYHKAIEDYNYLIEICPDNNYYVMRAFCNERIK